MATDQHVGVRKGVMIAGWVAATAVTTAVAYLAVGAAGARVNNRPLSVISAASPATSNTPSLSTSSEVPATTTAPTFSTTSTSASPSPSTATSATSAASEEVWKQQTVNSAAGTVVVSFRGEEVRLESVAPLAGFSYEIDKNGPDEVRVEFDGPLRVEVRARVRDGVLTTEIDEDS